MQCKEWTLWSSIHVLQNIACSLLYTTWLSSWWRSHWDKIPSLSSNPLWCSAHRRESISSYAWECWLKGVKNNQPGLQHRIFSSDVIKIHSWTYKMASPDVTNSGSVIILQYLVCFMIYLGWCVGCTLKKNIYGALAPMGEIFPPKKKSNRWCSSSAIMPASGICMLSKLPEFWYRWNQWGVRSISADSTIGMRAVEATCNT